MKKDVERDAVISRLIASLKAHRLKKGLSMNETAWRSGLDHTMIMRVENRQRMPTIDTLLRMADALDANLPWLLTDAVDSVAEAKPRRIKKPTARSTVRRKSTAK